MTEPRTLTAEAFAVLLDEINAGDATRKAGQVTPAVCEVWRRGGIEQNLVDAVILWELRTRTNPDDAATGRVATPADMREVVQSWKAHRAGSSEEREAA
jgi:hypothetical protein